MLPPKMGEGVSGFRVGCTQGALAAGAVGAAVGAASALTTTLANRATAGRETPRGACTRLETLDVTCMVMTGTVWLSRASPLIEANLSHPKRGRVVWARSTLVAAALALVRADIQPSAHACGLALESQEQGSQISAGNRHNTTSTVHSATSGQPL